MIKPNDLVKEMNKFIGCKVHELRDNKKVARKDLAHAIGVTYQQLFKYENGTDRISIGRLVLIARTLGTNIDSFCEGLI